MNTTDMLRVASIWLAVASTSAFAHDGPHPSHPAPDAAKVQETSFGRAGDARRATRVIKVDMSDTMRFSPSALSVRQGETVKFVVVNRGKVLHEMVLGTAADLKQHAELMRRFPGMEHADANMTHVKPGRTGEIVWQFSRAGEYAFACLIPGHFEAGMVGTITVK